MVDYTTHGRVAVITLDRPEARNAVNGEVASGIEAALDRLEADDECWIGVVAGNGPVFSAGADLRAVSAGKAASLSTERGGFAGIVLRERTKPLIAAVEGPALAGGFEIVLSCDLVVAATSASFGLPEVKRSLVAASGGLFRLPRAIPRTVAMELVLTGDPMDATRAAALGLVNELVEPGSALDAALALADRISANAPIAVRESRRALLEGVGADDEEAWRASRRAMATVMATEDFAEGPKAFVEKRPPRWQGR
jgi:enoyl-CoA hydratase